MLDFISLDVRGYMERNGLEFTDFEKAALIYHSGLPVLRVLELLERLAEKTEDALLKEQILARLASERLDMEAFRDNDGGYVYAVEALEDDEPYICGYFAAFDPAYAHGMKQGCVFEIQKFQIVGFNGQEAKRSKGYFNPNLMDSPTVKECITEHDYCGFSEATARYGSDGTLEYFWSSEIERPDEEVISVLYDLSRFENAFIYISNPFERGDIVQLTTVRESHGIVATSQREWKKFLEQVKTWKKKNVDFSDASITVDFLQDNGKIAHSHVNPAFLEKFEPRKGDIDYDILTAARAVRQDECTFDYFLCCLDK